MVPGPNNHTLDISGSITDACAELTIFKQIGDRVGKYLNNDNWRNVVDNFGKIPVMQSFYGSIHAGKYDADDTFRLVAFDPTIGDSGDWKQVTAIQNVSGS